MSLPHQIRNEIADLFDIEELKSLTYDLGINYDELPGDRLSGKANALFLAAYKLELFDELHAYLLKERPDGNWPSLEELQSFVWEDLSAVQFAGNQIIENIQHVYQEEALTEKDVESVIEHLSAQLDYVQILYFAFTGLLVYITHPCLVIDSCTQVFGSGAFDVLAIFLIIFGAIGLSAGAVYGYALVYIGEKIYTEKYNMRFLMLNTLGFGLAFFLIALLNNDGAGRGAGVFGGFIVGAVFGLCLTIPWWIRSVNDRIVRVLITVVLAVAASFTADYLFGFPVSALASHQDANISNTLLVWIIFGGSLSFYYSIWPQDIANILKIADLVES